VSKKETDILLIRKYLNGELDTRAMHQLEKRALEDPFLMDALEGYENVNTDQQANLDELGNRLQQRIFHKQRRIIPYRTLAIAASVLIIFTIGWLWLKNDSKPNRQITAGGVTPVAKPAPANSSAADTIRNNQIAANLPRATVKHDKEELRKSVRYETLVAPTIVTDKWVLANVNIAKPDTILNDTTPLNEMVVMDYSSQKKKDLNKSAPVASEMKLKEEPIAATEKLLQGAVAGVTKPPTASPFIAQLSSKIILEGRIIDKMDGMALPGVSVHVSGTKFGTLSDNNGKFSLPIDSNRPSNIVIAYIGYNTIKINTNNRDSLQTIGLEPNHSSLNEVVVVGYGAKKNDDNTIITAHPQGGWHSFKKYLNENAVSPDGKAGIVKLSFMVDCNGKISEVAVVKGLSLGINKKAIVLLNNGPQWVGNTSGQIEQVTIHVKFSK
jgi:hypothetical protein